MTSEERIQEIRAETERIRADTERIRTETEQIRAETKRIRAETEQIRTEPEQINRRVSELEAKAEERRQKFDEERAKSAREFDKRMERLEAMSAEHGRHIGGYGNKIGEFTEALSEPSIIRILDEHFDAVYHKSYIKSHLVVDAWGVSRNGSGTAYLVEIKTKFRYRHLKQMWRLVKMFRIYRPEFESKAVYPILAVIQITDEQRKSVWESGIHLIDVSDGVFKWAEPPKDFKPKGDHGTNRVYQRALPQHLRLVSN